MGSLCSIKIIIFPQLMKATNWFYLHQDEADKQLVYDQQYFM